MARRSLREDRLFKRLDQAIRDKRLKDDALEHLLVELVNRVLLLEGKVRLQRAFGP